MKKEKSNAKKNTMQSSTYQGKCDSAHNPWDVLNTATFWSESHPVIAKQHWEILVANCGWRNSILLVANCGWRNGVLQPGDSSQPLKSRQNTKEVLHVHLFIFPFTICSLLYG